MSVDDHSSPPLPAIVPPLPVRRFTVEEYHQMIQAGVLGEDDDVELLEGWIVPKMARNPAHDAVVSMVMVDVLTPRLPKGWFCRGQSAITTADSEPEPDVAVVRGSTRDYLGPPSRPGRHGAGDRSRRFIACPRPDRTRPGSTPPPPCRSTGSSTWSTIRLRSTATRPVPMPGPSIACARITKRATWYRSSLTAATSGRSRPRSYFPDRDRRRFAATKGDIDRIIRGSESSGTLPVRSRVARDLGAVGTGRISRADTSARRANRRGGHRGCLA